LSTITEPLQLPERPNLEQLRNQARELQKESGLKLSEAQRDLARRYGFPSWTKLSEHVELVTSLTREPDRLPPASAPTDEYLRRICLNYGLDSTDSRDGGHEMLRSDPSLATANVWTAAATASVDALRSFVAADRSSATREGGPFQWSPLMYLAYGRSQPAPSETDSLAAAAVLLDAGADPNDGYLWHGLPTPFTVLTGVFASGEQGPQQCPAHPYSHALARLLLERGANANDPQTLYNRMFEPGTTHLALLLDFGLGQGDGGPWQRKMTSQIETPFQMVQHQLRWAIHHDMVDRVRLFADHGVDLTTPFDGQPPWASLAANRTPADFAVMCGHQRIVDELALHGAVPGEVSLEDQYVGAILGGDGVTANRIGEGNPDIAINARRARPSLVVQAAATGRVMAVSLAVAQGFDINAKGRTDAPVEQPWETALHTAVGNHDEAMVRLLISLGADPSITDKRFNATPRGWAEHFGDDEMAALLDELTAT
jgi:hypothetical protein